MEKNKIFSKLNIKDYNNELEKILDNKSFSSDVKNLLLSMLYKVEGAYQDYKRVKVEVLPEKDFMENILKIIDENCNSIELISPNSKKEPQIDEKAGSILCYPNEKSLLTSIWYMGEKSIQKKIATYPYVEDAIQNMFYEGNNMAQIEALRDFNGWSWDIMIDEISNIRFNLIYEMLLLIQGKDLIGVNLKKDINDDKIKPKKCCDELVQILYNVTLNAYVKDNKEELEKILEIKKQKEEKLELFNNKKEFIENLTKEKKQCAQQIENIDRLINNKDLLKQEYISRNEKLPNKEKIFSMSHLVDKLESERTDLLDKMKIANEMLQPQKFIEEKEKQSKEVELLNQIDIGNKTKKQENNMIKYCKVCLKEIKKQIDKTEEKHKIIDWIYKIRYCKYIPFDKNKYLKDVKELEEDFKQVIMTLIKKAQLQKIWDVFSPNEDITYLVIKELLNTKMINLQDVVITCEYNKDTLFVTYSDTNILETKKEFKVDNVRIKKKIKLFI